MRKKEERWIVAFPSTTMALQMEACCHMQNRPGRLIPLPREISAGCGLAWCELPKEENEELQILNFMKNNKIFYEKIVKMEI